ncbi:hypothetical protein CBS101457_003007 [Exobasidium rhododendri]|nr:hypothetical protein CBS101457_003007 [Exobasidium rhododendri]
MDPFHLGKINTGSRQDRRLGFSESHTSRASARAPQRDDGSRVDPSHYHHQEEAQQHSDAGLHPAQYWSGGDMHEDVYTGQVNYLLYGHPLPSFDDRSAAGSVFGDPGIPSLLDDGASYHWPHQASSSRSADTVYASDVGGASLTSFLPFPQHERSLLPQYSHSPALTSTPRLNQLYSNTQLGATQNYHAPPYSSPPPEQLLPIAPPGEYQLRIDTNVPFSSDRKRIFADLPEPLRLTIFSRIAQIRPFSDGAIRYHLNNNLTVNLARRLLSENERVYEAATADFLPDYESEYGVQDQERRSWMFGLHNWQRREVIRRVAEVTLQSADKLREHFVTTVKDQSVPRQILDAAYHQDIWRIARQNNLILPPPGPSSRRVLNWRVGLTTLQRYAVQQRMILYGNVGSTDKCLSLLAKQNVVKGYGLMLLKASDDEFERMMKDLKSRKGPHNIATVFLEG